jgi:hypothetical protein
VSEQRATAEELLQRIENEVRRLRSGDEWKRWLKAAATFHHYSFRNVILILLQKPEATAVAGYHDWQKLDRQVVRGQAGIRILAPVYARRSARADGKKEVVATESEKRAEMEETRPPRRRLVGFKVASVFDISQTAGEPLAKTPIPEPVTGLAPGGLWDALAREVETAGFSLSRGSTGDAAVEGFTDHENKQIVIGSHLVEVTAVARLAHEVAHMRMHSREQVAASGSIMCRGAREVEAESVAYILLSHHGMTMEASSFPYIAGWAGSVDPEAPEKVLQRTGQRVVEMAQQLIDVADLHEANSKSEQQVKREPAVRHAELDGVDAQPVGPRL